MSIIIAMVFWIVGIVIMFGGRIAGFLLRKLEHKLEKKSKHNKFEDNPAHIAYGTGSKIVDAIPWYLINPWFAVFGLVVFAIGFVPLSFHYIKF